MRYMRHMCVHYHFERNVAELMLTQSALITIHRRSAPYARHSGIHSVILFLKEEVVPNPYIQPEPFT